jgi:hypothetical protein
VVSDDEVPDMISNMLPGTLFIRGNADNSALMEELSLQSAHRVILLSCESHLHEPMHNGIARVVHMISSTTVQQPFSNYSRLM